MFKKLLDFLTLGLIIGALPNNIVDGQVIDAVPVMADFSFIVAQVNANAASTADLAATNANVTAIQNKFNQSNTYVPVWVASSGVQPAIGNGSILGEYTRNGNTVHCKIALNFGTTTTFGTAGIWTLSLPIAYAGTLESDGFAYYNLGGGADVLAFTKILISAPSVLTVRNTTNAITWNTVAWGAGGYVTCTFTYQIAN